MTTDLETRLRVTLHAAAEQTRPPIPPAVVTSMDSPVVTALRTRRRRVVAVSVAGGAVAATMVGLAFGFVPGSTSPADAAIRVTRHASYVDAVVTDPAASARRLNQVLAREHLDVTVSLVPTSPSLVGTVVFSDGADVTPLHRGRCVPVNGGPCLGGFRISMTGRGHGSVVLGRAAKPGERYQSSADGLAPGEALHCSGLTTMRVTAASRYLTRRGLRIDWMVDGTRLAAGQAPPADFWATGTSPFSAREVVVEAGTKPYNHTNFPWVPTSQLARINRGC